MSCPKRREANSDVYSRPMLQSGLLLRVLAVMAMYCALPAMCNSLCNGSTFPMTGSRIVVVLSVCQGHVFFANASLPLGAALEINMTIADPLDTSAGPFSVILSNITMHGGSMLILSGGSSSSSRGRLVVTVTNVVGVDSAIFVRGAFEGTETSVLLSNVDLSISATPTQQAMYALTFPMLGSTADADAFYRNLTKLVVLVNVSLYDGATLTISNSSVIGWRLSSALQQSANPSLAALPSASIFVTGSLIVSGGSSLLMTSSVLEAAFTMLLENASLNISGSGSSWQIHGVSIYADAWNSSYPVVINMSSPVGSLTIAKSSVEITDGASWLISGTNITSEAPCQGNTLGPRGSFSLIKSNVVLDQGSSWSLVDVLIAVTDDLSSQEHKSFFIGGGSTVALSRSSSWLLSKSNFSATYSGEALLLNSSSVEILSGSSWSISSCSFVGASYGLHVAYNSIFRIEGHSSWATANCIFSRSDGRLHLPETPFNVEFNVEFVLMSQSTWVLAGCIFNGTNDGRAFHIGDGPLLLQSGSIFSISDSSFFSKFSNAFHMSSFGLRGSGQGTLLMVSGCFFSGDGDDAFVLRDASIIFDGGAQWIMRDGTFLSVMFSGFVLSAANITVAGQTSAWVMSNCDFRVTSNNGSAIRIIKTNFYAQANASMSWSSSRLDSLGNTIQVTQSAWTVESSGLFELSNTTLTCTNCTGAFIMLKVVLLVDSRGTFAIRQSSFRSTSTDGTVAFASAVAFYFGGLGGIIVRNGSSVILEESTFVCPVGGGIAFQAPVSIRDWSALSIVGSTISSRGATSNPLLQLSAISFTLSSIQVDGFSSFLVANVIASSSALAPVTMFQTPVTISGSSSFALLNNSIFVANQASWVLLQFSSHVVVKGSSVFAVRQNALKTTSPVRTQSLMGCANFGGGLTIESDSTTVWLENMCQGMPLLLSGAVALGADYSNTAFVMRCNTVNGILQTNDDPTIQSIGASLLPCRRCDLLVDCFWPLTIAQPFTKIVCASDQGITLCPCVPGCSTDAMCLPGNGNGACSITSPEARQRLGLWSNSSAPSQTRTASLGTTTRTVDIAQWLRELRPRKTAAATVALLSLALVTGGASSAHALQRLHFQQTVNDCSNGGADFFSPPDFSTSPTQMRFGPDKGGYIRGTVAGNLLVWIACCTAAIIVTTGVAERRYRRAIESGDVSGARRSRWKRVTSCAGDLSLPGLLYNPFSILCAPTMQSGVALIASIQEPPRICDAVLAVCGFAVIGATMAAITAVTTFFFAASPKPRLPENAQPEKASWKDYFFSRTNEWRDDKRRRKSRRKSRCCDLANGEEGFVARWSTVFDPYVHCRQWFVMAELAASLSASILAGLVPTSASDPAASSSTSGPSSLSAACERLQALSVGVEIVFLLLMITLSPYALRLDRCLALGNGLVTAFSSVLGFLNVDSAAVTVAQLSLNLAAMAAVGVGLAVDGSIVTWVKDIKRRLVGFAKPLPASRTLLRLHPSMDASEQRGALGASRLPEVALKQLIDLICSERRDQEGASLLSRLI